jgi:hypothetical protein
MSPVDDQPSVPDPLDFHDNPDPISFVPRDSLSGLLIAVFAVMVVLALVAITALEGQSHHAVVEPPVSTSG